MILITGFERRLFMAFTVTFPVDIGTFVIVDYKGIDLSKNQNHYWVELELFHVINVLIIKKMIILLWFLDIKIHGVENICLMRS